MNENIDLTEILINCPKGEKFYSSLYGDVEFQDLLLDGISGAVRVKLRNGLFIYYSKRGIPWGVKYPEIAKCDIFPSEDQRDWSKFKTPIRRFDPKELKPFDKVLVFDKNYREWKINIFSHIHDGSIAVCAGNIWVQCISYNDDTKHLVGAKNDCPEYYRWWE